VFTVFDGAEVKQELDGGSLTLGWKPGAEFKDGVIFEVIALGAKPTGVSSAGTPLAEHPSLAALEAAPSGFASGAGGTLFVKVGPGEQSVDVTLP
jgi:hypothetical protein